MNLKKRRDKKTIHRHCSVAQRTQYWILNPKRTMRMKRVNAFVVRLDDLFSFYECAQNDVVLSLFNSDSSIHSHVSHAHSPSLLFLSLGYWHILYFSEWNVIAAVLRVTRFVFIVIINEYVVRIVSFAFIEQSKQINECSISRWFYILSFVH